jgi:hypothetical protein
VTEAVTSERWDNPELDDNQVRIQEAVTSERWRSPELDGNQVWIQEAPVFAPVEVSGQLGRFELQDQGYLAHELWADRYHTNEI